MTTPRLPALPIVPGERHVPRPLLMLVAAAVVVAGTYLARDLVPASRAAPVPGAAPAAAAPDPAIDPGVLGAAGFGPGSLAQIDHAIGIWTGNLHRNADDFLAASNLAILYNARGRLTSNVDDYGRALAAARQGVAVAPTYTPARIVEATVLLAIHDFGGALSIARSVYGADPTQLGALAALGDAEQELGDYAGARAAYTKLAAATSGAAIDARLARFAYLTGDDARGLALASRARDVGAAPALAADDPAGGVFYHYQLAEMDRLTGNAPAALAEYTAALAIRPADLGSLVGRARVEAFLGTTSAAIADLRHAAAIAPQPDALSLLGDLLRETGDTTGATTQYATVRAIRTLSELAGSVYDRQLLLFELDHGGATAEVLARARTALASRADGYGHDVVAWALYRLGRYREAAVEATAARASGIRDARIFYHAGAIEIALGQAAAGRALVGQALALGPALDPIERIGARALMG